jgi:hypothetical protein
VTGARRSVVLTAFAAALALAGCGDDSSNGEGKSSGEPKLQSVPVTPLTSSSPKNLTRPLLPACATKGYVRRVGQLKSVHPGQKVWQINFQRPKGQQVRPGQTTVVLIVEQAPVQQASRQVSSDPQSTEVAGRRVKIRRNKSQWAALWTTGRATYTMLADGPRRTVESFAACLP